MVAASGLIAIWSGSCLLGVAQVDTLLAENPDAGIRVRCVDMHCVSFLCVCPLHMCSFQTDGDPFCEQQKK